MKPPTKERPWWIIEPEKKIACPHCDFSSGQRGGDTCSKCKGEGVVSEAEYFGEADMIRENRGILVRIETYPGYVISDEGARKSETALDGWAGWDVLS